jgi:hypothetical protein
VLLSHASREPLQLNVVTVLERRCQARPSPWAGSLPAWRNLSGILGTPAAIPLAGVFFRVIYLLFSTGACDIHSGIGVRQAQPVIKHLLQFLIANTIVRGKQLGGRGWVQAL